jgi:hypothetical protein
MLRIFLSRVGVEIESNAADEGDTTGQNDNVIQRGFLNFVFQLCFLNCYLHKSSEATLAFPRFPRRSGYTCIGPPTSYPLARIINCNDVHHRRKKRPPNTKTTGAATRNELSVSQSKAPSPFLPFVLVGVETRRGVIWRRTEAFVGFETVYGSKPNDPIQLLSFSIPSVQQVPRRDVDVA